MSIEYLNGRDFLGTPEVEGKFCIEAKCDKQRKQESIETTSGEMELLSLGKSRYSKRIFFVTKRRMLL